MKNSGLNFIDPRESIWGFHVHQELPLKDFGRGLVIQRACRDYLEGEGLEIKKSDALRPGYGPHLSYMWELRVEPNDPSQVLEQMGLAVAFMAVNRFGLSGYLHPLRHDSAREEDLATEGRLNQGNMLWFSERVDQKRDFFSNPPRDLQGKLVDTRAERVLSAQEKAELIEIGTEELKGKSFCHPRDVIVRGFHFHLDYSPSNSETALEVFDGFVTYLLKEKIRPTSTRLYGAGENGPHVSGGWEVKFETADPEVLKQFGVAIGWLMCNRQNLPFSLHPVTWQPGDVLQELAAHEDYWMFIDSKPELELSFFRRQQLLKTF